MPIGFFEVADNSFSVGGDEWLFTGFCKNSSQIRKGLRCSEAHSLPARPMAILIRRRILDTGSRTCAG
jgi:hypothetical protein